MMKATLFALFVFSFSLLGAEPKVVSFEKLQKRGKAGSQLIYITNQNSPFTGKAIGLFENGQKRVETSYRDGKLEGLFRWWYENGQKKAERNYKAGKLDGVLTGWHMNGQVGSVMNYQEGKPDGLVTMWYKNGQKMSKSNFKDGKPDGIVTGWYINGQKKWEGNWKEGKTVSAKSWKPNGEKCPATNVKDGNGVGVQYKDDGTEESRYTFKDGEPVEEERSSKEELEELLKKSFPVASPI